MAIIIESPLITKRRERRRLLVVGIMIIATLVVFWFSPWRVWLTDATVIRDRIQDLGAFGPVVVIAYHILQVIFAPIPGQALDIANGYVFGWNGIVVSLVGISLGSIMAIWLARRFGRNLVRRLIGEPSMRLLDGFLAKSVPALWILLLLPGTPDDVICYALGLSAVRLRRAVVMVILGRAPGVILAVGLGATGREISPLVFLVAMGVISVIAWWLVRWWGKRPRRVK